jgi:hypothetical protein
MGHKRDDYASYLLRLRRSDQDGLLTWRASLESTRDGQRIEFASVEALVAFLSARFGSSPGGRDGDVWGMHIGVGMPTPSE